MIIDGYTIVFQMINFLILVFLLRHFLYGPIIEAMDARETQILQREEEAAAQRQEAEEKASMYRRKMEDLQRQEESFLERAKASVEAQKGELLEAARGEVDRRRRSWEEALERERASFVQELRRRVGQGACSIARQCLRDLADARLESLAWDLFLQRIRELSGEERSKLLEALASDPQPVILRTAFETSEDHIEALQAQLQKMLPESGKDLTIFAETDPSLVCGLELTIGGHRVAWSIEGYLTGVEESILREMRGGSDLVGDDGEVSGRDAKE